MKYDETIFLGTILHFVGLVFVICIVYYIQKKHIERVEKRQVEQDKRIEEVLRKLLQIFKA